MPVIPLRRYAAMDPYVLLSAVNMQLRDEFKSLDDLCASQEIDRAELEKKLRRAGFKYSAEHNQFQ